MSKTNKKIKVNSEQISILSSQLISKKLVLSSLQESYRQIKLQLEDIIKKLSASTEVNEALLQSGMKVGAFSLVTNLAAGISDSPLDHNEVIEIAELSKMKLQTFMKEFLSQINISNN